MNIPLASVALRDSLVNRESNAKMIVSVAINDAIKLGICYTSIDLDKDIRDNIVEYLRGFGYKVNEYTTSISISWY